MDFRRVCTQSLDVHKKKTIINCPQDVRILSHLFLNYGQCHTLVPLTTTEGSGKNHGYSIMLNQEDTEPAYDGTPAGWHVFIHERTENFTGKNNINYH